MELTIKNIGKIKEADIKIDGITVIAGENDTGKSTVGKILFLLFNSLYELDKRIDKERISAIEDIVENAERLIMGDPFNIFVDNDIFDIYNIVEQVVKIDANGSSESIKQKIDDILVNNTTQKDVTFDKLDKQKLIESIYKIIEISQNEFTKSILEKDFKQGFNGQINNIFSDSNAEIELKIKDKIIKSEIRDNAISVISNEFSLNKEVIYIDNPFILDELNPIIIKTFNSAANINRQHLLKQIFRENDKNVFKEIMTKKQLNNITEKLNSVSSGNLMFNGREAEYRLKDTDKTINVKNLSAGLKTFVILKELLLNGVISAQETIILDEPEIHLHPEWQLIFAELIVLLQKEFDLHILLTTHSPYFLNAIEVFSESHGIKDKCNYYLATLDEKSAVFKNVNNDLEEIYKLLARPLQVLENKRYDSDDE